MDKLVDGYYCTIKKSQAAKKPPEMILKILPQNCFRRKSRQSMEPATEVFYTIG
jgi:hypothetical protein